MFRALALLSVPSIALAQDWGTTGSWELLHPSNPERAPSLAYRGPASGAGCFLTATNDTLNPGGMTVSMFDVALNRWETFPGIPLNIVDPFMTEVGGQLFVIDETNFTNIAFIDTSAARSTVGYPWTVPRVYDGPSPRYGQRFVPWGALIYTFGGYDLSTGVFHNDMWALPAGVVITGYQLPPPSWSQVATDGVAGFPRGRVGYTLTAFGTSIIMFGGVSLLPTAPAGAHPDVCFTPSTSSVCEFHSHVWMFSPGNPGPPGEITVSGSQWRQLAARGAPTTPLGRFDHVAGGMSDQLYVYGGTTAAGGVNEMWVYNIATESWAPVQPSYPAPDLGPSDVGYGVGLVMGRHLYRYAQGVDGGGDPLSGTGQLWRFFPSATGGGGGGGSPPSTTATTSPGLTTAVVFAVIVGVANFALLFLVAKNSQLLDVSFIVDAMPCWKGRGGGGSSSPTSASFYSAVEEKA